MEQVINNLKKLQTQIETSTLSVESKSKDVGFICDIIERLSIGTHNIIYPGERETLNIIHRKYTIGTAPKDTSTPNSATLINGTLLDGYVFVFTGFRNKTWESLIRNHGGVVLDRFSSGHSNPGQCVLIAKDTSRSTSKMVSARRNGYQVHSMREFPGIIREALIYSNGRKDPAHVKRSYHPNDIERLKRLSSALRDAI